MLRAATDAIHPYTAGFFQIGLRIGWPQAAVFHPLASSNPGGQHGETIRSQSAKAIGGVRAP